MYVRNSEDDETGHREEELEEESTAVGLEGAPGKNDGLIREDDELIEEILNYLNKNTRTL